MTTKNSLAGVSIANRLAERHDPGMTGGPHIDRTGPHQVIYVHPTFDMRFIGRYCTVKGERSGGYVIKACLEEQYEHNPGLKRWLVKHLKPGWTQQARQRACHRLFVELSEQRTMSRLREQVYNLAEGRDLDLDRIDKMAEAEGREIAYTSMTPADCIFWQVELEKFLARSDET